MRQLSILYYQVKPPVPVVDFILMNHWPKGSHVILQTSQVISKALGYSPYSDGKALFVKVFTYVIKHGEVQWVTTKNFNPINRCSQYRRCSTCHWRRKKIINATCVYFSCFSEEGTLFLLVLSYSALFVCICLIYCYFLSLDASVF